MHTNLAGTRHVVVVGGGVVGCATAYQLARANFRVTLIERDAIAAHASSKNAGNLNPLHGTPAEMIPFALEAFRIHAEVRAELTQLGCTEHAATRVKRVHVGYNDTDQQQAEETAILFRRTEGFSSAWLERSDLRKLEPRLSHEISFGLLTEGGLSVDGYGFTHSLADAAVKLGATIVPASTSGVAVSGQRVTGIQTDQRLIPCDEIVLATGPWIGDTNRWLGIHLVVEPVKGELLLMRLPGEPTQYDFTWGLTSLYRRGRNEVWVGVTTETCGFDCRPTSEARRCLLDRAARILPSIRAGTLLDHVAALRPQTPSKAPIAARASGWQNVYIANGGGSKGLLLSVGIARRIRDLMLDGCSQIPGNDFVN